MLFRYLFLNKFVSARPCIGIELSTLRTRVSSIGKAILDTRRVTSQTSDQQITPRMHTACRRPDARNERQWDIHRAINKRKRWET